MEYRNASFNKYGTIDCEVNHPSLGWIPFTANPDDCDDFGRIVYKSALISDPLPYVKPLPDIKKERAAMQCSHYQGVLALGEDEWDRICIASLDTPFAMRIGFSGNHVWRRSSQFADEFAWVAGYSAYQMDNLFRAAMAIEV